MEVTSGGNLNSGRFWSNAGQRLRDFVKMASSTTSQNRTHVIEVSVSVGIPNLDGMKICLSLIVLI